MDQTALSIWTVCKNPSDYPGLFTARRGEITPEGPVATQDLIVSKDLYKIRGMLDLMGLTRLERVAGDDPVILETWL